MQFRLPIPCHEARRWAIIPERHFRAHWSYPSEIALSSVDNLAHYAYVIREKDYYRVTISPQVVGPEGTIGFNKCWKSIRQNGPYLHIVWVCKDGPFMLGKV